MDRRHVPYHPAPELQEVLDDLRRAGNPLDSVTKESAADLWLQREVQSRNRLAVLPMAEVRDTFVAARNRQIAVRVYTPLVGQSEGGGKLPVLVYFHGGGWTLGSLATYDSVCRGLAERARALVIAVDYRLAPEHPFPAALADAYLAVEWAARNAADLGGDAARLALAGDSSGGTLATVTALRARKQGLPILLQALFYPSVDISRTDWGSYEQYGQDHWLTRKAVKAFRSFYLPGHHDEWARPEASPLLTPDADLRLMPPALIFTCGCDPLRDEGEAYARRLRDVGVAADFRLKEDMIHGCLGFYNSGLYPKASARVEPFLAEAAAAIRDALARPVGSGA